MTSSTASRLAAISLFEYQQRRDESSRRFRRSVIAIYLSLPGLVLVGSLAQFGDRQARPNSVQIFTALVAAFASASILSTLVAVLARRTPGQRVQAAEVVSLEQYGSLLVRTSGEPTEAELADYNDLVSALYGEPRDLVTHGLGNRSRGETATGPGQTSDGPPRETVEIDLRESEAESSRPEAGSGK